MSDGAKTTGVIGGIVAAIGAVALHGADDCARLGARGASVGDDFARVGARGAAVEGAGVRGGRAVGGVGDDLARVPGRRSPLGVPLVTDEAIAGTSPWRELAKELGGELAPNALEALLDSESTELVDELELEAGSPDRSGFSLVSLVPADAVGFGLAFGTGTKAPDAARFAAVSEPSDAMAVTAPRTRSAMVSALVEQPVPVARFVLGYVVPDRERTLAVPSVYSEAPISELAARCSGAGIACVMLACDKPDFSAKAPCALEARRLVDATVARAPANAKETLRALFEERAKRKLGGLTVYSAAWIDGRVRLAASRS